MLCLSNRIDLIYLYISGNKMKREQNRDRDVAKEEEKGSSRIARSERC